MIYKEFIAEAAQKIMASAVANEIANDGCCDNDNLKSLARDSVAAAKMLAEALDEDWQQEPVDGGIRRYAEGEVFFDNYVNWSKTK